MCMKLFLNNRILSFAICILFAALLTLLPLSFSLLSGVETLFVEGFGVPANPTPTDSDTDTLMGEKVDAQPETNWQDQIGLFLGNMLLSTGALIAFMGGSLLDLTITSLILEMGKWLTEGGVGLVINETWGVVRDVVNLIFIFGFVYIGIMTILDPGRLNTRSLLVQLVIAALLINFSLFFTKIVIDVANVFALEVNQLMDRGENGGIAATFASEMGLSSLYTNFNSQALAGLTAGGSVTFFIMGTIFLIITGFVFAAGAVMLVIRFVVLIFIMIGSPLYFAGMAFPQAKKFTKDIFGKLLGYAFYAPVFLFLIYISLRVVQTTTFGGSEDQFVNAMHGSGPKELNEWAIFLQFAVAIVLIIASLRIAKSFSMWGAGAVVSTTEGALKRVGRYTGNVAGGATFGTLGWAGRSTLGRWGLKASEDEALKDKADRKGIGGFVARRQLDLSRVAASGSYDARQVAGAGKKLGIGEGSKKGFKERREDVEKNRMKFAESLGEVKDDDEKVQEWQGKIDTTEDTVQDLKDQIAATPDGNAKKALQGQLRFAEFELKNYQEAIKYEKNRRQIGSAEANAAPAAAMTVEERENFRTKYNSIAVAPTAEDRTRARRELQEMQKTLKERLKTVREGLPKRQMGYAGVLEASPIINFFRDGHIIPAGEAIRKNYNKKFKRTKEDERTERMVDTFKSSK